MDQEPEEEFDKQVREWLMIVVRFAATLAFTSVVIMVVGLSTLVADKVAEYVRYGSLSPSTVQWFFDLDQDGFGSGTPVTYGRPNAGFVHQAGDCDDIRPAIHPFAAEICNERDDDCDGTVDEGIIKLAWFLDYDQDGYGEGQPVVSCTKPSWSAANLPGDCADWDAAIHPNAPEVCNDRDDDCNKAVDDGLARTHYSPDFDRDGYGADSSVEALCYKPVGYVTNSDDCADWDAQTHPGAWENPHNYVDDDCDRKTDEK